MKCKTTGKECYDSILDAKSRFKRRKKQKKPGFYTCRFCGCVHVTGKSKKKKTYLKRNQ